MAFVNNMTEKMQPATRIFSEQILKRYADPSDCLTAHLMLECAEVLAGVKPANLISISNRPQLCGRNLYRLWQLHHGEIASRLADLNILVLQTKEKAMLLLCYNRVRLERHLAHAGIRTLLHKAGYEAGASTGTLLAELRRRTTSNDTFPHEIGLFIGYPAKDVAAFMGLVKLPFACQCLWKVYGNPAQSLDLAERFRGCRQKMGAILKSGKLDVLQWDHSSNPFF
jgi:hypothetical protein